MLNKFQNSYFLEFDSNLDLIHASELFLINYNIKEYLSSIIKSKANTLLKMNDIHNTPNYFFLNKSSFGDNENIFINLCRINPIMGSRFNCNLTNLPNRDSLTSYLNSNKDLTPHFICLINIDDFSSINDVYGGKIGDKILVILSNFLSETFSSYNIYKLRDDEFAIISDNIKVFSKEVYFFKNILKSFFNTLLVVDNHEIRIGSTTVFAFESPSKLLKNANEALKYAKLKKINFFKYNKKLLTSKESKENSLNTINKIKHCISNNSVVPYYQAIIDNETGKVFKYEALMRLKYNNETLFPADFMELALKSKTYHTLTIMMLERVFNDVNKKNIKVSINLTMDDILNGVVSQKIFSLLDWCKCSNSITFEIIETVEIQNLKEFTSFIDKVKSYGVKISIDDFGTGYSNFEYYSKFDFDYLKIDGFFIKDILINQKHRNVVESLVYLTRNSNIQLIGEFVESKEIYETLMELGVAYSQGFYFSKAEPIEKLMIEDNNACI